jgi:hypothetical protein
MDSNDPTKKYFDIAPPKAAPATSPIVQTKQRQTIKLEDDSDSVAPADQQNTSETDDSTSDTLLEPAGNESADNNIATTSHPDFDIPAESEQVTPTEDGPANVDEDQPAEDEMPPGVNPLPGTVKIAVADEPATEENTEEPNVEDDLSTDTSEDEPVEDSPQEVVDSPEDPAPEPPTEQPVESETPELTEGADDNTPEPEVAPQDVAPIIEPQIETVAPPPTDQPQPEPHAEVPETPAEKYSVVDSVPDPGKEATENAKSGMQDPKVYDTKEYYVPIGNAHHKHGSFKLALLFGVICAVIVVGIVVYVMTNLGQN